MIILVVFLKKDYLFERVRVCKRERELWGEGGAGSPLSSGLNPLSHPGGGCFKGNETKMLFPHEHSIDTQTLSWTDKLTCASQGLARRMVTERLFPRPGAGIREAPLVSW